MDKLIIEARRDNLDEVLSFIDSYLEKQDCNPKAQVQLDIAVEEIYINIASYAYPEGKGMAEIRIEAEESGFVTITFLDSGTPYDPLAKEDPDITLSAEERQIGGLGIYMVKKSMDEVAYEYKDGKNIFSMKKKI